MVALTFGGSPIQVNIGENTGEARRARAGAEAAAAAALETLGDVVEAGANAVAAIGTAQTDAIEEVDAARDAAVLTVGLSGASLLALATAEADRAAGYASTLASAITTLEAINYRLITLETRPKVAGDILEAEIMGGTVSCAIAAGSNSNTIPANGKILRIRFKGIGPSATVDVSKAYLTVVRPGFGTDRVHRLDNVTETLAITGLYRCSHPDDATKLVQQVGSDLDTYWAISSSVFVSDRTYNLQVTAGFYGACTTSALGVITNHSTRPYEMPQVDLLAQPPIMRLGSDGLSWEWAVMHHGARNGQTVAAVECYIVDNTASPLSANRLTSVANAMTASTRLTPHSPPVFAGSFASSAGLTNGLGGMSVKVYPWISGPTPWDLKDYGAARVDDTSMPAFWPVCIDSDNSYKTARAYVSHTGAQIGSPTFTTSALGAYVPGTTPAFASVSAALTAGQAWNNNAANRARVHNDITALEIVTPNGTILAGFGGNISGLPLGNGPLPRLTSEAGANLATTGFSAAGTSANKTYRWIDIDRMGLFPTGNSAGTTLLDGGTAGASATDPATLTAAVLTCVRNCVGATASGTVDGSNPVWFRSGYSYFFNNTFTNMPPAGANYIYRQGAVIHGGTYDCSSLTFPSALVDVGRLIGARMKQLVVSPENGARTFEFLLGQFYGWNRFDTKNTGSGTNNNPGTLRAAGIGDRGMAFVGNLIRHTASAGARAALQIHADYVSGADTPPCRNLNIFGNTIAGQRYNPGYLEAGANTAIKEFYEYGNAGTEYNVKGDKMDPDGAGPLGPDGARTGNFAFRFGTDRGWNANATTSSSGTTYSSSSWLGDAPAVGDVNSIGSANMYVSNTSATGTNNYADDGDFTPAAALRNRLPSGRAPWRNDYLGRVLPNDGTGALGALQVA